MMIDQFKLGYKLVPEDDILEYVYEYSLAHLGDIWDDIDGNPYIAGTDGPNCFKKRYNARKIDSHFKYEDYKNNSDIQHTLIGLGIDVEKFWYLVLFLFDLSYTSAFDAEHIPDSPKLQIDKFINFIVERRTAESGVFAKKLFKEDITITVGVKGKKVVVDVPEAVLFIASACSEQMKKDKSNTLDRFGFTTCNKVTSSNSKLIWTFSLLFTRFFKLYPQFKAKSSCSSDISYNKNLLISRLAYFSKLTLNKSYLSDGDIVKSLLRQYKGQSLKVINTAYNWWWLS